MRIIPHELYPYAPDLALTALRKEHGMHDYCLRHKSKNIAMQPFLDLDYDYFNLLIVLWIKEMEQRNHYVNSFHQFYANHHQVKIINTDILLIIECCLQWDLKGFQSYTKDDWFNIINQFIKARNIKFNNWNLQQYNNLKQWYQTRFMKVNKSGNLKPVALKMSEVLNYFKEMVERTIPKLEKISKEPFYENDYF